MATGPEALSPVTAFALVGALGVGSQWLAWKLRLPGIVLMLGAGLMIGPVLGVFDPSRDIGPLMGPLVSIAVAIILFEGGLTLDLRSLRGAAKGVRRLVLIGAPLGWALSAIALHLVAGTGWATAAVFGGIMIVTGPTVIAPLLRQARLQRRPAQLLQWEAIVNDPVGALAAVLAFQVVLVMQAAAGAGAAIGQLALGTAVATLLGLVAGWGLTRAFRNGMVPEYMKVPVLFALVLGVFALSDSVLHESGLLAVTIMGLFIANADLPSFTELRRFKEHATVLLVSGVFILLAANMSMATLSTIDRHAIVFVAAVILLVRPATVLIALAFSDVPWRERWLVALTGPRGVVLVAVAGLFGERLAALGLADGARVAPLAFALVAATVVLHGFILAPLARALGLSAGGPPGVLIVGGCPWSAALGELLQKLELPVLIVDPNRAHLRASREAGLPVFSGDILSEAAEHTLDMVPYGMVVAATDNDAYNTLVATDVAPEFGRENVFQLTRRKDESRRHALPSTLGGRRMPGDMTWSDANRRIREGWQFRATGLSDEFTLETWQEHNPEALIMAELDRNGMLRLLEAGTAPRGGDGTRIIAFAPPATEQGAEPAQHRAG